MCAIEAGKRGRRVALIDHAERIGKKILISGGGRCNFTNLHCKPENFISGNPHFAKSALARYTPADFIALVQKHRIDFHEKTLGQLFCDGSAREIVAMLEEESRRVGVRIFLNTRIAEITRDAVFILRSSEHEFHASSLVVATGGLSIPKMGATPFGYEIAKKFGIRFARLARHSSRLSFPNRIASATATSAESLPRSSLPSASSISVKRCLSLTAD